MGGELQRVAGPPPCVGGDVFRLLGVGPLSNQERLYVVIVNRGKIDAPAARADGRKQPSGRRREEQEDCPRRRLFQRFQQGVGGVAVHVVGGVDDGHARAAAGRRSVKE